MSNNLIKDLKSYIKDGRTKLTIRKIEEILIVAEEEGTDPDLQNDIEEFVEEFIIIKGSLSRLNRQKRLGTIKDDEYERNIDKLNSRILNSLNEIGRNEKILKLFSTPEFKVEVDNIETSKVQWRIVYSIVFPFLFLALIYLLASYIDIDKTQPLGFISKKVYLPQNSSSSYPIKDITISAEIYTLDNLTLFENKIDSIKADDLLKKGLITEREFGLNFNTYDKVINNNPNIHRDSINPSFTRIDTLVNVLSRTTDFYEYYSNHERKEILQDSIYWEWKKKSGLEIVVFPKKKQRAVLNLRIKGNLVGDVLVITPQKNDPDGESFITSIKKATGTDKISFTTNKENLNLCVFEGEKIKFKTKTREWEIYIERIINPIHLREAYDLVILEVKHKLDR